MSYLISNISPAHFLPSFVSLSLPISGLYPDLQEMGEYMGLNLNSDEVQKNMALVPVADSVSL